MYSCYVQEAFCLPTHSNVRASVVRSGRKALHRPHCRTKQSNVRIKANHRTMIGPEGKVRMSKYNMHTCKTEGIFPKRRSQAVANKKIKKNQEKANWLESQISDILKFHLRTSLLYRGLLRNCAGFQRLSEVHRNGSLVFSILLSDARVRE